MVASRNHGKSSEGRKCSLSSISNQSPCFEALDSSTPEMVVPCLADLTFSLLRQAERGSNRLPAQP